MTIPLPPSGGPTEGATAPIEGPGALPADDYELLTRIRLDHGRMPPPMRLPVLFDSGWKHASTWTSWPVAVDPEA